MPISRCFVYANTTADTHRIAAELLETGIDVGPVNKVLFRTKSKTRLAMEARMVADMELYDGDRVVVMSIPLSLRRELHATEADIEELSSLAALVEGADCGITLRELKPGRVKLSRSSPCRWKWPHTAVGRWRALPPSAPGWKNRKTYESEVDYMTDFLKKRAQWMSNEYSGN